MRYFLSILVTTIFLLIVSQEIYAETIEYPDTNIYYEKSGIIYSYNPKSKINKEITKGTSPNLSPTGNLLAYNLNISDKAGVFVYNIRTNEKQFLMKPDFQHNYITTYWSQNEKYLIVEEGYNFLFDYYLIEVSTGKTKTHFLGDRDLFVWLNDDEIIYQEIDPSTSRNKYIVKVNLDEDQKQILKESTNKETYTFLQYKNNKILFSLNIYGEEGGINYWSMDANGYNLKREIRKNAEKFYQTDLINKNFTIKKFNKLIKKLLPEEYTESRIVTKEIKNNPDWLIINIIRDDENSSQNEILVMNKINPKSLFKIATGSISEDEVKSKVPDTNEPEYFDPDELQCSNISVYENNGIIYSYNSKTKEKKELVYGYYPRLSNNKTKFLYIPYSPSTYWETASRGEFYLYNLVTKENKLLYKEESGEPFFFEMWSPYDRYMVFDGGTSNLRTKYVFDTIQNKIIIDFPTYDVESPYQWLGEDNIIYSDSSNDLGGNTKIRKERIIDMKTLQIEDLTVYEVDENGHYKLIED